MGLLQVNNTILQNVQFFNDTLVQHPGWANEGILFIIFTDCSSGMCGQDLDPNTVFLTNNLYVLDSGVTPTPDLLHQNFVQSNNLVVIQDQAAVDLGFTNAAGTKAPDFDLVSASSPAVDAGTAISGNELDYSDRTRPTRSAPDIGAFEYGAAQSECMPPQRP